MEIEQEPFFCLFLSESRTFRQLGHRMKREVKQMAWFNCNCSCGCKCSCTVAALVVSGILGVLAAFFQITGMITVTPVFLWVVLAVAAVYLGILLLTRGAEDARRFLCACSALSGTLAGILGSLLFAAVLLAVGITATSIVSAILVGILLFFFSLIFTNAACLIRCQSECDR